MSGTYIDADTLDDLRNAFAMGVPLETLAGQFGTDEQTLRRRLRLPQLDESPRQTQLDLWAVDGLDARL